jgi:hypothetical protein
MGRNNYKNCVAVILFICFAQTCISQTIILRPYYGHKWYWSNNGSIVYNNFDPNSKTSISSSKYITGISLEYEVNKNTFELYFSSQPSLNYFESYYSPVAAFTNESEGSHSQFQFLYNRYIDINKNNSHKYKIFPILTGGFGIGIVTSQDLLNNSSYRFRIDGPNNEFIDVNSIFKKSTALNFSGIIKIGGVLKNEKREIIRLQILYNLGLNKSEINEINYQFTNSLYSGVISSKGTYFGVQLSLPIYLKRFNN